MAGVGGRAQVRMAGGASHPSSLPKSIPFTVDAALIRELGERLVGKPYIALAELVKNSYDADATQVVIRREDDSLEVLDDGHGMSLGDFEHFWARIGTTHKQAEGRSRGQRPLTGSKGVGRLAVQFLADRLDLWTRDGRSSLELRAEVDWPAITSSGLIQQTQIHYDDRQLASTQFPGDGAHGTRILLTGLKQPWDSESTRELANQLWSLQPPFGPVGEAEQSRDFSIRFECSDPTLTSSFHDQYAAFRDVNWYAKITGHLAITENDEDSGELDITVEFPDGNIVREKIVRDSCVVHALDYEIRVYHTSKKQRRNISLPAVRAYLADWGGVRVYDDGFQLPYYGSKDSDWLGVERDHAHRLVKSSLLPDHIKRAARAMNFLPTTSRLLGAVHVSTSTERRRAEAAAVLAKKRAVSPERLPRTREHQMRLPGVHENSSVRESLPRNDYLKILVTRDRLADNQAFAELRDMVRTGIDLYANEEARRKAAETEAQRPTANERARSVLEVLERFRTDIPKPAYMQISREVQSTIAASRDEERELAAHVGLLGALATAGMSALAYEHEVSKQLRLLQMMAEKSRRFSTKDGTARQFLDTLAAELTQWITRAKATRALFSNLTEEENREVRTRFVARSLLESVCDQVRLLMRGVPIDVSGVIEGLRLPEGHFAEWSALFQNVFFNAANAMLDSEIKRICVTSRRRGPAHQVLVQDTGCGVDLTRADELFRAFKRDLEVSPQRRGLVLGGMGLGLTIVRMIANKLECRVDFVEPEPDYSTAFMLSWSETK